MRRTITLAALLALAACGTLLPSVSLPQDASTGAGEPTRAAILSTAYVFSTPDSVDGQPAAAARAAAQLEYLATEIPNGPRWTQFSPVVGSSLVQARAELRSALGISALAAPQEVVDRLYGASRAMDAGDQAAARAQLAGPAFADANVTLARLEHLPALPQTRWATGLAQTELNRLNTRRR